MLLAQVLLKKGLLDAAIAQLELVHGDLCRAAQEEITRLRQIDEPSGGSS
ncbi:hypothetical protein HY634_01230 [Candidatus Uhrbacteria bacterium]|nr:hypothetical protein [Candidatus Uhrbacteria bacterium]